jgi:hypothetical protein
MASANIVADQTFATIQQYISTILNDPILGPEVPLSTKEFTYSLITKINNLGGISAYCADIASTLNLQFVEQKIFNSIEESRIDYYFVNKPIGVIPLTGLIYQNIVSTVQWNSEIEAPILGTNLPSSSLGVVLTFFANVEGWSLSDIVLSV